jgi:transposase
MRATRDWLRRRRPLRRKRAALLAHVPHTHSQSHLPGIGKNIAYKATRDGIAARFPAPAVQKSLAVDLALIGHYDHLLNDVEFSIGHTAKQPDPQTLSRLPAVPGIGKSLRLGLLDASHTSDRFPRGQDGVSYCRRGKCAKESAGKRSGTAGAKIGQASLQWAFSAAAGLLLRTNPAGQKSRAR